MVILLRRRYIVLAVILLLSAILLLALPNQSNALSVLAPERIGTTVIIDAGHGGADGGAVGQNGEVESEINLQLARLTREVFALFGRQTVLTRTGTDGLYNADSDTIRRKKIDDTRNRVELINRYENAALISIHQNSMPNAPKVHGAQVFYNNTPQAKELANRMQAALNNCVNVNNEKTAAAIPNSIYIMSHVNCDAVLVECGFLSNAAEAQHLQQLDYQRKLAVAIVCGYLNG